MNPKIKEYGVPKPLLDVWQWKNEVYRETEAMSLSDALNRIHQDVADVRKAFGLRVSEPAEHSASGQCVAETRNGFYAKPE